MHRSSDYYILFACSVSVSIYRHVLLAACLPSFTGGRFVFGSAVAIPREEKSEAAAHIIDIKKPVVFPEILKKNL
jgi:hypothetical protein